MPQSLKPDLGHHLHGVPDADVEAVIAKCWRDRTFREFLIEHPVEALRSQGIAIPVGVRVKAIESSSAVMHLVIPRRPEWKP